MRHFIIFPCLFSNWFNSCDSQFQFKVPGVSKDETIQFSSVRSIVVSVNFRMRHTNPPSPILMLSSKSSRFFYKRKEPTELLDFKRWQGCVEMDMEKNPVIWTMVPKTRQSQLRKIDINFYSPLKIKALARKCAQEVFAPITIKILFASAT